VNDTDALARQSHHLIGKRLLVGITRMNREGKVVSRTQHYGTILRINLREGLVIQDEVTGGPMALPPLLHALKPSPLYRIYRLKSVDRIVTGIHFTVVYTLRPPVLQ